MKATKQGFTLIELLAVLAVVALLSGLIFPLFARARLDARRTTSISNLRQCGMLLKMYCDDYGGYAAMPSAEVAAELLKKAPTCDPNDTWRKSCDEEFGWPLIGSYAYTRAVELVAPPGAPDWEFFHKEQKNATLMMSVYYASFPPAPFHGDKPQDSDMAGKIGSFMYPDRTLRLRLDGSVRLEREPEGYTGGDIAYKNILVWSGLFFRDIFSH